MEAFLVILAWIGAGLLSALAAVLILPVRFELHAEAREGMQWAAALRPLGRFGPRIGLSGGAGAQSRPRKARKSRSKPRGRDPVRLGRAGFRLASDLLSAIRIETLSLDLRFGCGDPAETGQIYGMLTPLIYGTSRSTAVHVVVEPAFDRAMLEGQGDFVASLRPVRLLPILTRFGWAVFGPGR